jgi:PTS system nitrogen regulatory IIA component
MGPTGGQEFAAVELGVKDLVVLFGVPERTIERWLRDTDLPRYRVHDQYRFNRVQLLEWATARGVSVSPGAFQPAGPAAALRLADLIESGGIHYGVPGDNREAVLAGVVHRMRLPEELDVEFLLDVLLAREALGSTGIGDGIAVPHARNPIIVHAKAPVIALAFLRHPVDFGALDGQPVYCLFTMVTPTVRAHLDLLSRLSFALRDAGVRAALVGRAPAPEILAEVRRVEAALPPPPAVQGAE